MTGSFITYMFVLGLGTSLHCVSMCGPLVLTYAVKGAEEGTWYRRVAPNVAYQGAKMVSYMLVGLLLGTIGSALNIDAFRPYVMFLAGAFMIVLGLGMTGRVKWAQRFTPRPPAWLISMLTRLRRKSTADAQAGANSLATPVFFGLITGLLPCGPLMAAQVSAAASGSTIAGGLGMAAFALGTAPLMIAFGTAGSLIPRVWKERMMVVLAVGVMVFGLVFINRGLMLTGAPVNFASIKSAVVGGSVAGPSEYATGADGVVEVPLVIDNVQFVPQTVSVPADKPVRLVVERREDNACSDQLALPQLGVLVDLKPNGTTVVNLPATKAGTYTLTCGMGMMSGQLSVGVAAAGGASASFPVALVVAVVGGGIFYVSRRSRTKHVGGPAVATADARGGLFGFSATETVLIGAALVLAVLAGLVLGGMFS